MSLKPNYIRQAKKRGLGLSLTIDPTGQIIVHAPRLTPNFVLDQFVAKNQAWIKKQQAKLKQKQLMIGKEFVYLLGKRYRLTVDDLGQPIGGFYIKQDQIIYQPPKTIDATTKIPQARLNQFLKTTAINYITPRAHQLAQKMNLKFNRISFRQQKTRWGSCSSQKNLNFNWRLVHFEPAVIDYVIIHELAHLKYLNHSARFWALVAKYDGKYKEHKKVLRNARY